VAEPNREAHRISGVNLAARLKAHHSRFIFPLERVDSERPEVPRAVQRSRYTAGLRGKRIGYLGSDIFGRRRGSPLPVLIARLRNDSPKAELAALLQEGMNPELAHDRDARLDLNTAIGRDRGAQEGSIRFA
jgi:hypothetical protein